MGKIYEVTFKVLTYKSVYVEAESEEEATKKGARAVSDYDIDCHDQTVLISEDQDAEYHHYSGA